MERKVNLLTTVAFATALVGTAFAQEDLKGYKWRADQYNHGWKMGFLPSETSSRAQTLATNSTKWVTLTINRVAQVDNLDQGDALGKNRADFYALVWVNGQVYKSGNYSKDAGTPNWTLKVPVTEDASTIRIRLMEDDGGLEEKDDHVDINPMEKAKDLLLKFDSANGAISGDITGTKGTLISSTGLGDDDKGKISFTIG